MEIIDKIKNNTLIICPNEYKERILLELSKNTNLYNLKFMTMEEYENNYFFSYDVKAINYLCVNYDLKVANTLELLNNLKYVTSQKYTSSKLNYLVSLKKELDVHNLLIYNHNFGIFLKNRSIIIYGYHLDNFTLKMFNNPLIIDDYNTPKTVDVYHFDDIEREVEFVFNDISELLSKGISINKIGLMNIDSSYIPYLKMFSNLYQIPINLVNDNTIIGTYLGKYFLQLIEEKNSRDDIFLKLEEYKNNSLYQVLIDILNKYVDFDYLDDVKKLVKYDLENRTIPGLTFSDALSIKKITDLIMDDEYIYLMNFNNASIPIIYNDINYLDDSLKDELQMSTTMELNRISQENTLNKIYGIKNIKISYKDKTPFDNYYPSILLDDLKKNIKGYDDSYRYSVSYNKIKYAYLLDEYVKYGFKDCDLSILYGNYGNVDYRTYSNQFTGLDNSLLYEYLNNKLTLSYSHIDNYFKCAFQYYLSNILQVNLYEETFNTNIGTLFHNVLSHYNDDSFDVEKYYQDFINSTDFSAKELFFLHKLKKDLYFVIDTIKDNLHLTGFNQELYEKKIAIILKDNPSVIFKGFIDKIMYLRKDDETLVSIIDYKTGNVNTSLADIKDGLSLQLPVYLYLLKMSKMFSNIKFTGFYLMHILDNEIKIVKNKTYQEIKRDNLKLVGYSSSNLLRLSIFDSSYANSQMIKGMKVKKDGTLSLTSKGLSDEEINAIIETVTEKIEEAMENILKGQFTINPKIKGNINLSCQYCSYNDICYKREKDSVYLESGDNDDKMD